MALHPDLMLCTPNRCAAASGVPALATGIELCRPTWKKNTTTDSVRCCNNRLLKRIKNICRSVLFYLPTCAALLVASEIDYQCQKLACRWHFCIISIKLSSPPPQAKAMQSFSIDNVIFVVVLLVNPNSILIAHFSSHCSHFKAKKKKALVSQGNPRFALCLIAAVSYRTCVYVSAVCRILQERKRHQ